MGDGEFTTDATRRLGGTSADHSPRIAIRVWIGVVAAVVYVGFAAGLGNAMDAFIPTSDPASEYALSHIPVLIPVIVAGVVFVWLAGWGPAVWRVPTAWETTPRRLWLLPIPVLLVASGVVVLAGSPWGRWNVEGVALAASVTALVGFGEELFFRGVLRAAVRARHGETVTLLVTSLAFGVAHSFGSFFSGLGAGFIAFQVLVTTLDGAVYYGIVRATGRLWPAMALHALTDFSLVMASGTFGGPSSTGNPSPIAVTIETVVWALTLMLLISCIRQDLRSRKHVRRTP